jgi:hypothetical protein
MLGSYLELLKTSMTAGRGVTVRQVDVERARLGGRRPRSAAQGSVVLPVAGVRAHGRDAAWRAWICPGFSKCGAWVTTARHGWRRRSRPPRPGGHGREAAWLVGRRRVHGCTHTRPGERASRAVVGAGRAAPPLCRGRARAWRGGRRVWVGFGLGLGPGTVDLHRTTESVPLTRVRTMHVNLW